MGTVDHFMINKSKKYHITLASVTRIGTVDLFMINEKNAS
jgi:hypothetical protein